MRSYLKFSLFALILTLAITGCEKEYEPIEKVDEQKIQSYITSQKLSLTKDPSGIYYQIVNPGTGESPKNSEIVFFTYTAKTVDGKVYYDGNSYTTYANYLGYVKPEGWRLALQEIKKGGKIRVVFPSTLGFGRNGSGLIGGNEVLDSELELFDVKSQPEMEDIIINKFIINNSLSGFTKLPSGIYYKIIIPGSGTDSVTIASTVTVAFTGRLLSGTVFDSATPEKAFTSRLQSLIGGWKETVPLIKKGGKLRILIPSASGYGVSGSRAILPNSILDFDIELTDVKNL
ncbi:MAG: FKBP-type peptidyl-prolyl cis-trans isomerase [Flavobacterium sp.]|nr:FKBP-type peptidyl-prolyl cis-trans isomerase [Pedobacter sp.]